VGQRQQLPEQVESSFHMAQIGAFNSASRARVRLLSLSILACFRFMPFRIPSISVMHPATAA
jgi:hypothetical protein